MREARQWRGWRGVSAKSYAVPRWANADCVCVTPEGERSAVRIESRLVTEFEIGSDLMLLFHPGVVAVATLMVYRLYHNKLVESLPLRLSLISQFLASLCCGLARASDCHSSLSSALATSSWFPLCWSVVLSLSYGGQQCSYTPGLNLLPGDIRGSVSSAVPCFFIRTIIVHQHLYCIEFAPEQQV